MQCIIEKPKSYKNLDNLRHDLASQDVQESKIFQLGQMHLSTDGALRVAGVGEFLLTEIALQDALRRGGLHLGSCEKFFSEESGILDQSIVDAANSFYKFSKSSTTEVKLITKKGEDGRIAVGIPSSQYALFRHEAAVEKLAAFHQNHTEMRVARAVVYPEYMQISLTDPLNTVRDTVGEVVQVGLSFLNSEGSRRCSFICGAYSERLVCVNGMTATDTAFSVKYAHRGTMMNGDFFQKTEEIFGRFAVLMEKLPKLGEMPLTDKLLTRIKPELVSAAKKEEAEKLLQRLNVEEHSVMDLWNAVTNLPHRIQSPTSKLQLESLGFKILSAHLN